MRVRVQREDAVADVVLDERERAAGGGVVGVDQAAGAERAVQEPVVADAAHQEDDTRAIRAFNDALLADRRIDLSLVPIGDGMTLALKR